MDELSAVIDNKDTDDVTVSAECTAARATTKSEVQTKY